MQIFLYLLVTSAAALVRTKRDSIGQNRLGNFVELHKNGNTRKERETPPSFHHQIADYFFALDNKSNVAGNVAGNLVTSLRSNRRKWRKERLRMYINHKRQ